eukprot:6396045-Amphidinium_carterae.1
MWNRLAVWFIDSMVVLDDAVEGFSKVPFLRAWLRRFAREDDVVPGGSAVKRGGVHCCGLFGLPGRHS